MNEAIHKVVLKRFIIVVMIEGTVVMNVATTLQVVLQEAYTNIQRYGVAHLRILMVDISAIGLEDKRLFWVKASLVSLCLG